MSAVQAHSDGSSSRFLLALIALLTVAVPLLYQLPGVDQIKFRPHAVERHGQDALDARRAVRSCKPRDLRVKFCPRTDKYGIRLHFYCQSPGAHLCPGIVTTIGGIEKTSFTARCSYWARCQ